MTIMRVHSGKVIPGFQANNPIKYHIPYGIHIWYIKKNINPHIDNSSLTLSFPIFINYY